MTTRPIPTRLRAAEPVAIADASGRSIEVEVGVEIGAAAETESRPARPRRGLRTVPLAAEDANS